MVKCRAEGLAPATDGARHGVDVGCWVGLGAGGIVACGVAPGCGAELGCPVRVRVTPPAIRMMPLAPAAIFLRRAESLDRRIRCAMTASRIAPPAMMRHKPT